MLARAKWWKTSESQSTSLFALRFRVSWNLAKEIAYSTSFEGGESRVQVRMFRKDAEPVNHGSMLFLCLYIPVQLVERIRLIDGIPELDLMGVYSFNPPSSSCDSTATPFPRFRAGPRPVRIAPCWPPNSSGTEAHGTAHPAGRKAGPTRRARRDY